MPVESRKEIGKPDAKFLFSQGNLVVKKGGDAVVLVESAELNNTFSGTLIHSLIPNTTIGHYGTNFAKENYEQFYGKIILESK